MAPGIEGRLLALQESRWADERVEEAQEMASANEHRVAVELCDVALSLHPDHFEAHIKRGDAFLAMRRPEESMADFNAALQIKPGDERARAKLKEAKIRLQQLQERTLANVSRNFVLDWEDEEARLSKFSRPQGRAPREQPADTVSESASSRRGPVVLPIASRQSSSMRSRSSRRNRSPRSSERVFGASASPSADGGSSTDHGRVAGSSADHGRRSNRSEK
eukprot:Polyplicarium_translucidae@DN1498_c0_g1_i1.p4